MNKILYAASNSDPQNDPLSLDVEYQCVKLGIKQKGPDGQQFIDSLDYWPAFTVDLLPTQLPDNKYWALHFSGHGDPKGNLYTAGANGQEPFDASKLAKIIEGTGSQIRLVVLIACYSDSAAESLLGSDSSPRVVDIVVGVSGRIADESARRFVRAFYVALAYGRSVADAFVAADGTAGASDPRAQFVIRHRRDVDPHEVTWPRGRTLLPTLRDRCAGNVIQSRALYDPELYVPRRELEDRLKEFLESKATTMVIVGQSGMGKTTLAAHLVEERSTQGRLSFYINSGELPQPVAEVEQWTIGRLAKWNPDDSSEEFWCDLNAELRRADANLLLVIDALNEYNSASRLAAGTAPDATPVAFLGRLDALTRAIHSGANERVKILVTTRPEIWERGRDRTAGGVAEGAYFATAGRVDHVLRGYAPVEAEEAYRRYRDVDAKLFPYATLDALTKHMLRDPLLLRIASLVYEGRALPTQLETGEVFRQYEQHLRSNEAAAMSVVDLCIDYCFSDDDPLLLERDAVDLDRHLSLHQGGALARALTDNDANSHLNRLLGLNVLRKHGNQIRFGYDRFAEYLLSEELFNRIGATPDPIRSAQRALIANLDVPVQRPVTWRALRRTLRKLVDDDVRYSVIAPDGRAEFLARLARGSKRGLKLVVDVMATLAMRPGGLDVVDRLLKDLEKTTHVGAAFPVVDAVYEVVTHAEYRAWRESRANTAADKDLLLDHFVSAMGSADAVVSSMAIQYVFFLWQTYPEAASEALKRTIASLRRLSLRRNLADALASRVCGLVGVEWSQAFAGPQRAIIKSMAGFLILALAEAPDDAVSARARAVGSEFIAKLGIHDRSSLVAMARLLGPHALREIFAKLKEPINLISLESLLTDEQSKDDLRKVLDLIDPSTTEKAWKRIELEELVRLSESPNSYVLQMLCFALSVRCARERASALALVERLFFDKERRPQTKYVAALAMYHINYFSRHEPTDDSIALMGRMASHLLEQDRGRFRIGSDSKDWSYHIIGTFGRALQRQGGARATLRFVAEALADAVKASDGNYYMYICENVGLLGTLVERRVVHNVFAIVSIIHRDLAEGVVPPGFSSSIRAQLVQSLANIRVLYRAEVDEYLLDSLDDVRLQAEVAIAQPQFDLAVFYSWTSEQLFYRIFTQYERTMGVAVLKGLRASLDERESTHAMHRVLMSVFEALKPSAGRGSA